MKKMKKILAMLLSMAMVLGMTVTAFADENPTITVLGGELDLEGATYYYAQIIKTDRTTRTGWAFKSNEIGEAYQTALGIEDADEKYQNVIDALIKKSGDARELQIAISLASAAVSTNEWKESLNPQWGVTGGAGIYLIKIAKTGMNFNPMSAYLGFGEAYPEVEENVNVTAKGSKTSVTKTNTDDDGVVSIGDLVGFEIATKIPYVDPSLNDSEKGYYIYDQITGGKYVEDSVVIKVNDKEVTGIIPKFEKSDNTLDYNDRFSIDLSSYIDDKNSHLGESVSITYSVDVTGTKINNDVAAGKVAHDWKQPTYGQGNDKVYSSKITFLKYAKGNKENKLSDAEFELVSGNTTYTFTQREDGIYVYDKTSSETKLYTDNNGQIIIEGLGKGIYHFKETKAPEGYSVNEKGADVTIENTNDNGKAQNVIEVNQELDDTQLSSLPSTGGIGTTIFTIGGCAIMIIAAGLYFSFRKKSTK